MTLIVLGIYALAVMRVTRLINADTILDRPRVAIITRARASRMDANEARALGQDVRAQLLATRAQRWATLTYFIQCPWCVGMWLSLLTAWAPMWVLNWFDRPWYLAVIVYLAVALAVSHLVGVCARFADTEEIDVEDDEDD